MPQKSKTIRALLATLCLFWAFGLVTTHAYPTPQDKDKAQKAKKDKDDKEKTPDDPITSKDARPVLWTEPTDIESRDLFYGLGGRAGAPDPAGKFKFVRRSTSGTSEKIIVEDDKGRGWTVKFGPEARPETAATRILWAAGYHVDQNYFVARTHIEGRGGFDIWDVRFEARDDGFKELGTWEWDTNPFNGTRELAGLKVVMALLNNWDLKDMNNKVLQPNKESGGDRNLRIYYIADLGATLGATGSFISKLPFFSEAPAGSKGVPDSYAGQVFIDSVSGGQVHFHYEGKNGSVIEGISVEHARWMGNLLGRLSDKQLSDAFRAGGFTANEVAVYTQAMRRRIDQLKALK
jgi:hypothetical protein